MNRCKVAAVVFFALLGTGPAWVSDAMASTANQIHSVEITRHADAVVVEIAGDRAPNFTTFKQRTPRRVIVDVAESDLSGVPDRIQGDGQLVNFVSTAHFGRSGYGISRFVIGLQSEAEYRVTTSGGSLFVHLTSGDGGLIASAGIPVAPPNTTASRRLRAGQELTLPSDIAPSPVADEEHSLAGADGLQPELDRSGKRQMPVVARVDASEIHPDRDVVRSKRRIARPEPNQEIAPEREVVQAPARPSARIPTAKPGPAPEKWVIAPATKSPVAASEMNQADLEPEAEEVALSPAPASAVEPEAEPEAEVVAQPEPVERSGTSPVMEGAAAPEMDRIATANAVPVDTGPDLQPVALVARSDIGALSPRSELVRVESAERAGQGDDDCEIVVEPVRTKPPRLAMAPAAPLAERGRRAGTTMLAQQDEQADTAPEETAPASEEVPPPPPPPPAQARPEVEEQVEIGNELKDVTWIGFQQTQESSRVFAKTNVPVRYRVTEEGDKMVVLELENARIPLRNNRRFLDTHFFDSAVTLIQPREIEGVSRNVRIEIQLRNRVPYTMGQEGNMVFINFQRSQ